MQRPATQRPRRERPTLLHPGAGSRARPALEALARLPAELTPQLRIVDRVAQIVAGPVRDEADEVIMRTMRRCRQLVIEDGADPAHDLEIAALGAAADIVGLADPAV